jgi:hypothetical protein
MRVWLRRNPLRMLQLVDRKQTCSPDRRRLWRWSNWTATTQPSTQETFTCCSLRGTCSSKKPPPSGQDAGKGRVVPLKRKGPGRARLRPVLITVAATILALFPLASHGGPLWQPHCYGIGGLAVATFITLLLVPVLYSIAVLDLKVVKWDTATGRENTHVGNQEQSTRHTGGNRYCARSGCEQGRTGRRSPMDPHSTMYP